MQRLLTEALEKAGVSVERIRLDEAGSGGGLCLVRGRRIVYLDRNNSAENELRLLTEASVQVFGPDTFLPPAVREWIDNHAQK